MEWLFCFNVDAYYCVSLFIVSFVVIYSVYYFFCQVKKDPGGVLQQKVRELSSRVRQLEEDNLSLVADKTQLVSGWQTNGQA